MTSTIEFLLLPLSVVIWYHVKTAAEPYRLRLLKQTDLKIGKFVHEALFLSEETASQGALEP